MACFIIEQRTIQKEGNDMNLTTLLLLAIGLSMDAFAVAICKGLAMQRATVGKSTIVGLWFGGFQGLMPFLGYVLGVQFATYISKVAPWIAFVLLVFIGADMIKESLSKDEEEESDTLQIKEMFILAIATSIDAFAVGITFACVPVKVLPSATEFMNTVVGCGMIALTTFIISGVGVKIGNVFGTRYKNKAEFAGGAILVFLGIKILLDHFGIF